VSQQNSRTQAPVADDEIDLLQLMKSLWAGKWTILGCTLLIGCIGTIVALNTPPTYQADALLQLEDNKANLSVPTALTELSGEVPQSTTEIEILKSRLVIGQAVSNLNLDWQAGPTFAPGLGYLLTRLPFELPDYEFLRPYATGGEKLRLDLLRVPPEWLDEDIWLKVLPDQTFSLSLPNDQELQGTVGEIVSDTEHDFAIRVGEMEGDAGKIFKVSQIPESKAVANVRSNLSVSEKGRNSGILELRFTAGSHETAQSTLHAISQAYVAQNVRRSAAEAQKSLEFVESQLPIARKKVEAAEDELNRFKQSEATVDLGLETETLLTQISLLDNELRRLQVEELELKERYTPNHPVYAQLLDNKNLIQQRIEQLREETVDLPQIQRDVIALTRALEVAQDSYLQMLTRAQELRVLQASSLGHIRIVDQAQSKSLPVAPRKSRVLGLALILGIVIGTAIVLLRNALRRGVRSSAQLEELGLPVFATINRSKIEERAGRSKGARSILAISDPTDLAVEAFRSLRTSLHFGMLDASSKSVAITSPAPTAGKSFTSTNFAVVAAQSGQRVCLIDGDMRRGRLYKFFGAKKNDAGLADILAGDTPLEDAKVATKIDGLEFIPCGKYPPNPADLLARPDFKDLLKDLNSQFDLVIVDCPPVLALTDASIIAQHTGVSLLVARFDETPVGEVEAVLRTFENDGLSFTGAILNGFDPKKSTGGREYYYQNYRYDYKSRE